VGDNATVSASAHFHNLQLQKSPSRVFGQNSGNSADISKAFFEMGISKLKEIVGDRRRSRDRGDLPLLAIAAQYGIGAPGGTWASWETEMAMEAIPKGRSWLGPWSGLTHCGKCHALMGGSQCPGCGHALPIDEWMTMTINGREHKVPANVTAGALSWTAHSLLRLMKREWERPLLPEEPSTAPLAKQCSQRVLVVILFWTLFEHLMDQFFQTALNRLPRGVRTAYSGQPTVFAQRTRATGSPRAAASPLDRTCDPLDVNEVLEA
jgi:hypothetical protein